MKRKFTILSFIVVVLLSLGLNNSLNAQSDSLSSTFTLQETGCVHQHINIVFTGNASGDASYAWNFDGAVIISGSGQGPYWVRWETAGLKTVSLTVTWNSHTSSTTHTIHILPAPAVFHMTGGGSYPSGGTGVEVGLGGSESGRQYKLRLGGTYTGVVVTGTGNAISFGLQTIAGSYNAVAVSDACIVEMEGTAEVTILDPPAAPAICMVTFDTLTHHNIVIWNKSHYSPYQKMNVFREMMQNNVFEKIGEVAGSLPGTYLDTVANPLVKSDKYKISLVNMNGIQSEKSLYHKTIHLNINPGLYGYNLIWNYYEGFDFLSYHIWRKIGNSPFELLTGVASNVNSYTDFYETSGLVTYYIEVVRPEPCNPSLKSSSYNSIVSNIATAAPLGIEDNQNRGFIVYPNPAKEKVFIVKEMGYSTSAHLELFRTNGQLLMTRELTETRSSIDLTNLSQGVYFIRISTDATTVVKKMIKD